MIEELFEFVFRAIFYPIGWPVVKLITLGKYPSKNAWFSTRPESDWTMGIGIAISLIAMMAALAQFEAVR
ncbi:hypothetical protein PSCICO_39760 [Pseudomonas cichorii]|uniref:Uncharacterized protein n=1 Tax=Pseudomonas serbiensis TaxID=3064350 RepID=A0ABT9CQ83_9PSED|nr:MULTISPECIES: hypothetical protein [Pseudomonas]MDO7926000.1 hypothetical protein [Pseudomonas sp. KFB-138]GFM80331.1 hypothetical protein PSCICN_10230 [Pseudomonas cichorii]GFM88577.1 hypothetical protein PSCICO_39760 [Pseudomonas cichorii]